MIRWTLPRFRYDQIMKLCWQLMLPLSLANIFFTGAGILLWDKYIAPFFV
jgi:NADH-quinone oxidoreductase subunit H